MNPLVSILTPSIPERAWYLTECRKSVDSQVFTDFEHLIGIDEDHDGCAISMNRLAGNALGEWLLPLADDDLLLPGALETLVSHADEADIIYAPPLVTGNEDRWWFFQEPPAIPSFALIRKSLWQDLGGYDETLIREEDRNFWTRALAANARFLRVDDAPVWVYRQWAGQKSFAKAAA